MLKTLAQAQQQADIDAVVKAAHTYIDNNQQADGSIPWFEDGKLDPWDHTEAAMAMTICGNYAGSQKALRWLVENQNDDGSWFACYFDSANSDSNKIETNFVAYPACGLWHYYTITQDIDFVRECFPAIKRAINFVLSLQKDEGDIQWAISQQEELPKDALVTACSSILRSLECAILLAKQLKQDQPLWLTAYEQLAEALKNKPWRFDRTWPSKERFSMDWFYPILSGLYLPEESQLRLDARWHEFVHPSLGCRCVSDEPWVTVAESCELTLALIASKRKTQAIELFTALLRWQDVDGGFWTGYSFRDEVIWPREKTTWTAAAICLAADALYSKTPAAQLFTSPSQILFP